MHRYHTNLLYRLLLFFIALCVCCQVFANTVNDCQGGDQYQELLTRWPTHQDKQLIDKPVWLTIEQVSRLPKEVVWVDVRPKLNKANNPLTILNIPLNQLQNKNFLFDKTVVLIGTGFDQLLLNKAIYSLKQKGFKHLFALSGGIRTWRELKQPNVYISGEISPEEFLLGGKTIGWQVVTVGLTAKDIDTLPEKPVRNFSLSKMSILALSHFLGDKPTSSDAFIQHVLIAPNEPIALFLKKQLNLTDSPRIVWLKGGLTNYQQYVQQQIHLINSAGQSLSKPCRLTL